MSFKPFRVKTVIFGQNQVHRVNTGQTMSTRVKNEFQAVFRSKPSFSVKTESTESIRVKPYRPSKNEFSGQNRHFRSKPSPSSQYWSNHVDQGKKWVLSRFGSKRHFRSKPSPSSQYGSDHVDRGKKWVSGHFGSKLLFLVKTQFTGLIPVKSFFPVFRHNFRSLKWIFSGWKGVFLMLNWVFNFTYINIYYYT